MRDLRSDIGRVVASADTRFAVLVEAADATSVLARVPFLVRWLPQCVSPPPRCPPDSADEIGAVAPTVPFASRRVSSRAALPLR